MVLAGTGTGETRTYITEAASAELSVERAEVQRRMSEVATV